MVICGRMCTMFLIVGLGNPGEEYKKTKHNAGWIVLDGIVGDETWNTSKNAHADFILGHIGHEAVIYMKPLTFMNESGSAVNFFAKKENVPANKIIVIHDELDLAIGTVRISFDRGAGGHNGITSIQDSLGTSAFVRIRIGVSPVDDEGNVRRPTAGAQHDFVLKQFNNADYEKITNHVPNIKNIIAILVTEGVEAAMTKCN